MPEFSIIIPVYNGEAHLRECLDSMCGQTFEDIEVICVDDLGTDASADILVEYARKDPRVRVLRQSENHGSARARRRGVIESCGDYVLFSDQDDSLSLDACQVLHDELLEDRVDILQYGTEVINDGGVPEDEIRLFESWLEPVDGHLSGRGIIDACFVDYRFSYSIWNKAYRGDMARRAMAETEDVSIPLGEDNYASFVFLYFAETYRGLPGRLFYHYHFGRGYTGHNFQTAQSFNRTIGLVVADRLIRRFLEAQGAFECYRMTYEASRLHILEYIIDRWAIEIAPQDKRRVLHAIVEQWGFREVFAVMRHRSRRKLPMLFTCLLPPASS